MSGRISHAAAVDAARKAIQGKVTLTQPGEVRVSDDGDRIVVEFTRRNAPGERGPDYEARVTLDARSGQVIEVLGGS
jgi:hypothetical protein